jgi:hypothetical protein
MKMNRMWLGILLLLAIVASSTSAQRPATRSTTPELAEGRLPQTIFPEHYDLHFAPDFKTDTFAGDETISVRLTQPSDQITLHAAEIDFDEVTITARPAFASRYGDA